MPVYLKVMLPTPGVRPFGYAGPQASFELRCRRANGASCEPRQTERKKTVYGGVIGGGVRLGGRTGLSIEGRYVYGLTDLKLTTITNTNSFRHRTFMVLVTVGN